MSSLPPFRRLLLSSCNLMASGVSLLYSPNEVYAAFLRSLKSVLSREQPFLTSNDALVIIPRPGHRSIGVIPECERPFAQLIVKLFILNTSHADQIGLIEQAIDDVMSVFHQIQAIDLLTLALPDSDTADMTRQRFQEYWPSLEAGVRKQRIRRLGVADLDLDGLDALYNEVDVKPSVLQIRTDDCCGVSESLTTFCRKRDIEIIAHRDKSVPIDAGETEELFNEVGLTCGHAKPQPQWLAKFSVIAQGRGIVLQRGYLTSIEPASAH